MLKNPHNEHCIRICSDKEERRRSETRSSHKNFTFGQSLSVSVSKLVCIGLMLVDPGDRISEIYYCDIVSVATVMFLPDTRYASGEFSKQCPCVQVTLVL